MTAAAWPALCALVGAPSLQVGPAGPEPAGAAPRTPLWQLVERCAGERGLASETQIVLDHMAGVPDHWAGVQHRLPRVLGCLAQPWSVPATAAELRDLLAAPLRAGGEPDLAPVLAGLPGWLDLSAGAPENDDLRRLDALWAEIAAPDLSGRALLARLSEYMETAHRAAAAALAGISADEQSTLFQGTAPFLEAWYRSHFPGAELPPEQARALEQGTQFHAALKTERRRTLAAAAALQRLAAPSFLAQLGARLANTPRGEILPEGFAGDVVAAAGSSPAALVVLGGRGATRYRAPAALVVDLGGDDAYEVAAMADGPDRLASVVLDLRGDDTYDCAAGALARAVGGVAILVDRQGRDRYRCGRFGQAAAAHGVALLADLQGDDLYEAEDFAQGYSLCGVALLYDASGDDTFTAWAYAQGAGNGPGMAALVDGGGDDCYFADGRWPDVYGDSGPNIFHGASQGYSAGLRRELPGGIAACVDLGAGRDRYQSGNFSQGGGYYFAFGLLYDDGGGDENFGTRYSQGFGVHQAVGVRWDRGGDDRYSTRSVASLGMGWDEGVGWFLDDAGDDAYESGGLALGGAAQTAIAMCVDGGGDDRYQSAGGTDCQGGSGGSEYHGKPSIGMLLDLGGGRDRYSRPGREDNALSGDPGCGLFLDAAEHTVDQILRRRRLAPR